MLRHWAIPMVLRKIGDIQKLQDGGQSWEKVLFTDENTGGIDLAMNPQNPDILYAGMWSIHINTWGLNSGGPNGGIYQSLDGGKTWKPMSQNGLPGGTGNPVGKVAVAIAPSNPDIIYALFEMSSPALYRSVDGGKSLGTAL